MHEYELVVDFSACPSLGLLLARVLTVLPATGDLTNGRVNYLSREESIVKKLTIDLFSLLPQVLDSSID